MGAVALSGLKIWSKADCCADWVQEVKAKEYVPRPAMLGLGATPSEILQRPPKKHIRQVSPLYLALFPHQAPGVRHRGIGGLPGTSICIS